MRSEGRKGKRHVVESGVRGHCDARKKEERGYVNPWDTTRGKLAFVLRALASFCFIYPSTHLCYEVNPSIGNRPFAWGSCVKLAMLESSKTMTMT